ncbi:imidazoleglycerol-phosphate dehydratase HisB [candidate division KSB1 bacterium]|nr:imidazoleglycerol-phosphate dehydratase HisB [candidate division KSB1 bacterium]
MARQAVVHRKTKETDISIRLDLDGRGEGKISTGIGFFDHLLEAFKTHSRFDLAIEANGDLHVDDHHTVEDVGIVLGSAFLKSVGDASGIARFGHAYCPLDEALARCVVDISGRSYFAFDCPLALKPVGQFNGEMFPEFLRAFASNASINLHLSLLAGTNQHHALEAMMKAFARALGSAVLNDDRVTGIPSTKGKLV